MKWTFFFSMLSSACLALWSCSDAGSAEFTAGPRCEKLEKRFEQALASGGTCSADADCACYGQSTRVSKCGGVTDKKTAAELAAIAKEFRSLKCPRAYRCAYWNCVPACYRGKCVSSLLKNTMEKDRPRGKK